MSWMMLLLVNQIRHVKGLVMADSTLSSCMINVGDADWRDIRVQKSALFSMLPTGVPEYDDAIEGVLSFLDSVQDRAEEVLGHDVVFGSRRE